MLSPLIPDEVIWPSFQKPVSDGDENFNVTLRTSQMQHPHYACPALEHFAQYLHSGVGKHAIFETKR
jgi:hypothetical protein